MNFVSPLEYTTQPLTQWTSLTFTQLGYNKAKTVYYQVQWTLDLTNLYITNDFPQPGQNYSKIKWNRPSIQRNPRHNEHNPETQS